MCIVSVGQYEVFVSLATAHSPHKYSYTHSYICMNAIL